MLQSKINPHPCAPFLQRRTCRGRRGPSDPTSRSAPDGVTPSQKNERVALNERKPMVPNFKVSDQPMTSEVRSNARGGRLR